MVIEYEISKYIREKAQMTINDTKNIFLQGTNPYDGLSCYFGIWINNNYLVIATLISGRNISYEYYSNKNVDTKKDIIKFLEDCRNVKIISKSEFKNQIQIINTILEI